MPGLYIHLPFCVKKCSYCDFYSLPDRLNVLDSYLVALHREGEKIGRKRFNTLYLGGGTPSLLGPQRLTRLMSDLKSSFNLNKLEEATIEVNPDSTTAELCQAALDGGINRLSIGIQSLHEAELSSVGRVHTSSQAVQAIATALKEGFQNISTDVILGLPGQQWPSLMITLETLIGLGVRHLSVYCLALEPHTPLASNPPPDLPSDDEQASLYESACSLLAERGFVHYEISNFAWPGFECQHNLNYWRGGDYLGLGPAAASHWKGRRYRNQADLDAYLLNPTAQTEEVERLAPPQKAKEEAILRLRLLQEGLNITHLAEKFGDENILDLISRLNKLVKENYLRRAGSVYRLPESCALVSNPILAELLGD